jgi:predicted enzyme related to lactoylglutathione lyase
MPDPFDALRAPVTPAEPDPAFAARLRARLERALALPEGVAVTDITVRPVTAPSPPVPEEHGAAIPYLAVRGARAALDWYAEVLGARLRGEPIIMPDGRVGHAELELAGGVIYLAEEHPEIGVRAPQPGGVPVSLVLTVADLDDVVGSAVTAGARLDRGPYEGYGHRNATVTDPYGHRWMLQAPLPAAVAGAEAGGARSAGVTLRQGDISYASLWVPDVARAAAFYGAVLGVEYVPAHDSRGRQAADLTPPQGFWESADRPVLFCSYVVDDAAEAVARVRAAGGRAGEPVRRPYGLSADCVDTDGLRFAVHQPPPAVPGAVPSAAPGAGGVPAAAAGAAGRDGDLIYVTLEVTDPARTLAFYGVVLGWRSRPGRTPGGWQVEGTTPMIGVSGGHAEASSVPVWQVTDVAAAVGRVRAEGGTSTEPHREPYGLIAECTDDQETRFSLTQFPR